MTSAAFVIFLPAPVEAKGEYRAFSSLRKGIPAPTFAARCLALPAPPDCSDIPLGTPKPAPREPFFYAQPNVALVDSRHGQRTARNRSDHGRWIHDAQENAQPGRSVRAR